MFSFKRRRQKKEVLRKMKFYAIKKMPKNSIRKVTKDEVYYYTEYDHYMNDDIWQALIKFSERAPSYYDKITRVSFGETTVVETLKKDRDHLMAFY